jgi:signal peptidase I
MADPSPSPQTAPPAQAAAPTSQAITPAVNGVLPAAEKQAAHPGATLADHLRHWGLYAGLLAGLWVAAFVVLLLAGLRNRDAIGFATVAALVGSFFARSFLPQLHDKPRAAAAAQHQHVDSAREIIETIVFVVVLVLLLRSFTAEAFVIPTGSMAESLYGYQKIVTCPQCKLEFPVNCSSEVDPSDGSEPMAVTGCTCPNCRQDIKFYRPQDQGQVPPQTGLVRDPSWRSGDRVLVAKFVYDLLARNPDRLDVVVFKFPGDNQFPLSGPVKRHVPINYIKRLIGLPGETIAIHRGKLWVLSADKGLSYDDLAEAEGDPGKLAQLWKIEHTHHNDLGALKFWGRGEFVIIRKGPENLLAMRRLVYDNDHQAQDLTRPEEQRWVPDGESWSPNGKTAFKTDGQGGQTWLRYRHVLRGSRGQPQLITDYMGYNTWAAGHAGHSAPQENWASDLMVECEAAVSSGEGTFTLELSRGADRFQASFDLATGECTLYRLVKGKEPEKLGSAKTRMKGKGTYAVRFANVDDRLTVWVDERLPFGDGVAYDAPRTIVPTKENDLERPVSIGSEGARVAVSKLKVFRDTYYTTNREDQPRLRDVEKFRPDEADTWSALAEGPVATWYIQPGHYLCLGDNSPESSDGRSWGLVPRRLLLGRALLVYYPFSRVERIR